MREGKRERERERQGERTSFSVVQSAATNLLDRNGAIPPSAGFTAAASRKEFSEMDFFKKIARL
jgi:hypothetical protein